MARNPHASYEASDHQRMPIIPKFTDYIANNLTTTVAGFALDARQGKILNDTKLNIANVVNNLTTTVAGYALDARQGKALDDKITSLNNSLGTVLVGNANNALLDIIVNNKSSKNFPFTIQKYGQDKISDAPGVSSEFNAIIFGDINRWTILLVNYSTLRSQFYIRNGFQNKWMESNWKTITFDA